MEMLYLVNQRLPTEKAYGIQIQAMAGAFEAQGVAVTLLVRPTWLDFHWPGGLDRAAFWLSQVAGAVILALRTLGRQPAVVYCREEVVALAAALVGQRVVVELHSFSWSRRWLYKILSFLGVRVVGLTPALAARVRGVGFSAERILVAPDGVDLALFENLPERAEARRRVHLPLDLPIVLYAGHFYKWKGVETLCEAASLIDGLVVLVGGTVADLQRLKEKYGNVPNLMLVGHRPHGEIPLWLRAADVLVLPNLKDGDISEHFTSPLKMFEYMAAGTPIVASDLPSIREVLNEANAILVQPGDPQALAENVRRALTDSAPRPDRARQDVQAYGWEQRAKTILNFLAR